MIEQGGEIRIILDYAPAITPLVLRLPAHSLSPDFRARLVQAMIPARGPDDSPALSDRELEVLHLLDSGLTNQEIADQLVLTTGTVKQHLNHIYRKLGVSRRTEALREGRKRGLLLETTPRRQ
jgi:DNA-binding NarL/FixJ family response regulator